MSKINSYSLNVVLLVYLYHVPQTRPDDIPDYLYRLPLIGDGTVRRERSSTLLEPLNENVDVIGETGGVCEGACISARACTYYGGQPKGSCINGNVCCKFERTCDGIQREKIAFFQSPLYPSFSNETLECRHFIYPNEDHCALRVDFIELKAAKGMRYTGGILKCIKDNVYILNTKNGPHDSICEYQDYSAILHVNPKSSKPVIILFVMQSEKFKWKLRVTQLNCKKLTPWKNEVNCGRQILYDDDASVSEPNNGQLLVQHSSADRDLISPYIVNGEPAEQREFPWQSSLQVNSKHRCGATIISEYFLLTAAHCLYGRAYEPLEKYRVIVGDLILDSDEDGGEPPQIIEVESVILNYDYKEFKTHVHDIAIVKLKSRIKFTSATQPICLATFDHETTHKMGIVTGFGRLNSTHPAINSPRLQKLQMNILPNEECKEMHLKELRRVLKKNTTDSNWLANSNLMGSDNNHVCAITSTNSTVCFGDSGGPLVTRSEEDGHFTQVGVVSYGLGECGTSTPVAFTRVSEYLQFIALATTSD